MSDPVVHKPVHESDRVDDTPNARDEVEVTAAELPLHCPMPGKRLWDSHPKVFLPISSSGREVCPYCGTVYILIGPAGDGH